jgi:hypothetical protein
MAYHTLRAPARRLLEVIRDGEVSPGAREVAEDFTFADGDNIRVPRDTSCKAGDVSCKLLR